MLEQYQVLVDKKKILYSSVQVEVIRKMECVKVDRNSWGLEEKPKFRGIYLYGDVGRGKSLLMNLYFYEFNKAKKRIHFHDFMSDLHSSISTSKGDVIGGFVEGFAKHLRLLCLDEFHIKDIADAMIMFRLIELFLKYKVFLFLTSNYHPDDLYKDGLNRGNFLPAIDLIKGNMKVIPAAGEIDYRKLDKRSLYFIGEKGDLDLDALFVQFVDGRNLDSKVLDLGYGRELIIQCFADELVWFNYADLRDQNLCAADYKLIGKTFRVIFLAGINGFACADNLRRFILMIDQFYECRVKLFYSATKELDFFSDDYEFQRALSRICSMNS